jgi:purine-binding chemotaxis protein CheW
VVSLATLFTGHDGPPTRFVVVRVGERRVALAVDAVLGVFKLDLATAHALPPLAQDADADTLQAIGALDAHLLFVLNSTCLVPDEVWQRLVQA